MSKSNHQKYGFHPSPKWARGIKGFFFIPKLLRYERWNGRSLPLFSNSEVGGIEGMRFIESGGQI